MKLSRSQYAHFKLNVEEIMDRYNWANIANGIELRPGSCNSSNDLPFASSRTNTVDMQVRDWDRRDNSLKEFLLLSLPSEWKGKFNNVEGGGCELWQAIIHEFENETHDSHTQVLAAMYNIMQGNNESLESFVERLFIIIRKLEGMGETVSSNTKVMCFFNGLNSLYKPEDVNILLEQQLSLEQAAQLIAEFAECKRHEHERNHPLVQQVVNLIDLKPESQPVKTTAKSSTLPAPVPPDKATKFPVGELIDVHSAEQSSTSSNGAKKDAFSTHPTSPSVASPVLSSPTSDTHLSALHRTAFEVTSLHRGLQNDTGENNCFLNVTIQALWHLGPFRAHLTSFIQRVQQQPGENTKSKEKRANGAATVGLLDALCNLFVQ